MFGSVATWKIHSPFDSPSDQEEFVRDLVRHGIKDARAQWAVDMFMGALAPDLLITVSLYETRDDALAAAAAAKGFVAREYQGVIEVIDKVIGSAFELRQFLDVDPASFLAVREDTAPMIAQFVTWRLKSDMQEPDDLATALTNVWSDVFPVLRAVGLCDIVAVQTRPDELLALRLFLPHADELPGFDAAIAEVERRFNAHGIVASARVGLGWDSQHLTSDRDK
jgi:hypothetical protein